MADMKWYVLRTAGSKEKKAADFLQKEIERSGLQDQVGQILVPVKREIVTKNGKRKVVEKLLYSGYVFIQAQLSGDLEYIIRNLVPGMSGFLTEYRAVPSKDNDKVSDKVNAKGKTETKTTIERIPIPLRDDEVQRLLGDQDENIDNPAETEVNYEIGESVKITDGPFSGFSGTVDAIEEDRSKLKVIVVIFGRKTLLELSFTQVTKE
jgi:transcriptional antiterminator NusG